MGYTVGEEFLFKTAGDDEGNNNSPIVRMESCISSSNEGSALLQINVDEFMRMGMTRQMVTRGVSMVKDFKLLMGVLENNY